MGTLAAWVKISDPEQRLEVAFSLFVSVDET